MRRKNKEYTVLRLISIKTVCQSAEEASAVADFNLGSLDETKLPWEVIEGAVLEQLIDEA